MNTPPDLLYELTILLFFFAPINVACLFTFYVHLYRNRSRARSNRLASIGAGLVLFATFLFIVLLVGCEMVRPRWSHTTKVLMFLPFAVWTITTTIGMGLMLRAATIDRTPVRVSPPETPPRDE